jgi:class 3 adenylate cyclase/Tol biopolymer transport system component
MFSDIVGYSKMMQENETLAMTLLGRHNGIIREAIKKHEGKEIKVIGDAFLVSFATVANAVRCAIEIQERFGKYNESASEKEKTQVRIGIHMGDIIVKDNDVFGDGVNIASRIEPLAEPGGICISQEVYSLVKQKLDLQVVSLGPKELKNIKDKVEIYEVLVGSITSEAHRAKRKKKQRKYWAYGLTGLLVVAIGLLIAIKILNKPTIPMLSHMLNTGGMIVEDPNISPDGNWIAYVATDSKFQSYLYIVPTSGGEPRKITNDTVSIHYETPCFSPDASQIVCRRGTEIHIIPTLGGRSHKIVSDGRLPVWSPDGKHIAFFRHFPSSAGMELFIVNPDGTGETKLTQIKPVFAYNVAWSPDSRQLAFLRSFQDTANNQYSEIFVREVKDSTEHQITFDKKVIDDFCWSSTGEIVFNSNRGGSIGLWVIPDEGGTPKQLTLGAGADEMPRISKDAKQLVYLNESETSDLWTVNLHTKELQQLTFEDASIETAAYSWDGSKLIYYLVNESDNSQNSFVICNKDGSEPTKFMPKAENYILSGFISRWSADMKFIYFSGSRRDTIRKNPDSIVVQGSFFEHELATNVTRKIGDGWLSDVSRDGKYVLYTRKDEESQAVLALTSAPEKAIKEISGMPFRRHFSWDSKNVIAQDSIGVWIIPVDENKGRRLIKAPKLFRFTAVEPNDGSLLGTIFDPEAHRNTAFVKFDLAKGKIEEIIKLSRLSRYTYILGGSPSPDGTTYAFGRVETKNKIIVLHNFR